MRCAVGIVVSVLVLLCSGVAEGSPGEQPSKLRAAALVLVNSTSTGFELFTHYVRPYLDHFGVELEG